MHARVVNVSQKSWTVTKEGGEKKISYSESMELLGRPAGRAETVLLLKMQITWSEVPWLPLTPLSSLLFC